MIRPRAIDSMTIQVQTVPATTAAGMRAHEHRANAITAGRLPVARGARVVNRTRFMDAIEGLDSRDIRSARRLALMRARQGYTACAWSLTMAIGAGFWFAVYQLVQHFA